MYTLSELSFASFLVATMGAGFVWRRKASRSCVPHVLRRTAVLGEKEDACQAGDAVSGVAWTDVYWAEGSGRDGT